MGPLEVGMVLAAMVPLGLLIWSVLTLLTTSRPDRLADLLAARAGVSGPATETLRRAVARSRACSALGLVAGLAAGLAPGPLPAFAGAVGGFLLGAAVAATVPQPTPPGSARVASLVPRRAEDYIGGRTLLALRGAAGTCALVCGLGALLPSRSAFRPEAGTWLALGAGALVVALLVETAARRLVRRPQLAATPEDMGADDALRSYSVHALVGSGIALVLFLLGAAAWKAGVSSDVQLLRWCLPPLAVVVFLAAPIAWVRVTRRTHDLGRTPVLAA